MNHQSDEGTTALMEASKTISRGYVEHIDLLSERYTGAPYPWYGGRDQVRIMLYIRVDKVGGLR